MSSVKSIVLFLVLGACSLVLASPHVARNAHHWGIAARVASPQLHDSSLLIPEKRALRKRCKVRPGKTNSPAAPPPPATSTKQEESKPTGVQNAAPPPPPPSTPTPPPPPPPKPTPTPAPPPPPPTNNGPSFMNGVQTGAGTFYATGLGACGIVNNDSQFIAAASHKLFDNFPEYKGGNPNSNPMCGRQVRVTFEGKSIVVALTDRCEACDTTDLDFSPAAFNSLANPDRGRIFGIKWEWI